MIKIILLFLLILFLTAISLYWCFLFIFNWLCFIGIIPSDIDYIKGSHLYYIIKLLLIAVFHVVFLLFICYNWQKYFRW